MLFTCNNNNVSTSLSINKHSSRIVYTDGLGLHLCVNVYMDGLGLYFCKMANADGLFLQVTLLNDVLQ